MRDILAAFFLVFASTASSAASPADEIEAAEARLEAGLAARDVKLLDPLIAEPFSWIHSSDGRVDDRKTWLEGAARGMALSGQRSSRTEYGASLATHGEPAHTAVRIARVRLVNAEQKRESWIRQSHTWVRKSGQWQLIMGQGVGMYDGPPLDSRLHARYA
ncbi:MAG: nuclear transport factor 2 family protein, partial [Steroidobacteraceae bacterium]|nr:nuclear transport factor 2 family protein [Steroidobacteraceae bacterium]